MSDFTLSPPILAAILCNAPPLVFQPPPLLIIIAQSLIHARINANKLVITAQPIRNLRTSNEQKGVLIAGVPYPLSPTPLLFPHYPLALSMPATKASGIFHFREPV